MRQANLSEGEARAAIAAYRRKDEYGSEAIAHYGGTTKVIQDAIARRNLYRGPFLRDPRQGGTHGFDVNFDVVHPSGKKADRIEEWTIPDAAHMPSNWSQMSPQEQYAHIATHGTMTLMPYDTTPGTWDPEETSAQLTHISPWYRG